MTSQPPICSRRLFLLGTATSFAGALLAACGKSSTEEISTTDVPVGSAVIVGEVIIAQPTAGEYKAYSAICPHQGYPITQIDGETAKCNRHASVFSLKDGSVISGPARDPMTEVEFSHNGETITIS